jgi:tRNA (adenine22-N1)-methyltransferase
VIKYIHYTIHPFYRYKVFTLKSNSQYKLKLGKRLQKIEQMVASQYCHIWDCCCDHGLLGGALLSKQITNIYTNSTSEIHFVDIVPELMVQLEKKLQRFYINSPWQTHCLDVASLPLQEYEGKHLVIIAGVGGDLMIKFIEQIYAKHKNLNIDFLLCPVHHLFSLRSKLIALDLSFKDEKLIEENNRFYEVLLVSTSSSPDSKISSVGNKIWLPQTPKQTEIAKRYLAKTIAHYQRIKLGRQQGNQNEVNNIIDVYQSINL